MAEKLRIGMIGMSEGNGHPYSWSAIFNGYNPEAMKECPFPVIPEYLEKQNFLEDSLNEYGEVTHIWTQDIEVSKHIAKASKIKHVVSDLKDMISEIDAVLLARDDAENHYEMALPFLKAGLPIFIDKPLALSEKEAMLIFESQKYNDQIFSCSSFRYSEELKLSDEDLNHIGEVIHVEASVQKKWDTYSVHLIEPVITQIPHRGRLQKVISTEKNGIKLCIIEWENVTAFLKVTGWIPCPFKIEYFGVNGNIEKKFLDSFSCFKESLKSFISLINNKSQNIDRAETIEIIKIIERGRS